MAEEKPRPSMDHHLLGAALAQVRDADAWWADRSCLIFMALTCVRSGEAREATWDEVDMARRHMDHPRQSDEVRVLASGTTFHPGKGSAPPRPGADRPQ